MTTGATTSVTGPYAGTAQTDQTGSTATVDGRQEVRKDDFLRLLTTQLRHQDPLSPMKETEFVTQLAQFSQLEATQNLAQVLTTGLWAQQQALAVEAASRLLGRTVTLQANPDATPVSGVVEAVQMVDGMPQVVVGGQAYPLGQVVRFA